MSDSKDENLAEELFLKLSDPKFVQQQVQNVIDLDWQLGIPVMQADQDGIYEIKPDGAKIYQKKWLFRFCFIVSSNNAFN